MPVKQISKPNLQPLVAVLKSTADRVNSYGNTLRARLGQRIAAKVGKSKSLNGEHSRSESHTAAWQAIIDALPGAAIALDASGVVRHHNAAVSELYPKIKTGQPISHMSRNPEFMNAVEKIFT